MYQAIYRVVGTHLLPSNKRLILPSTQVFNSLSKNPSFHPIVLLLRPLTIHFHPSPPPKKKVKKLREKNKKHTHTPPNSSPNSPHDLSESQRGTATHLPQISRNRWGTRIAILANGEMMEEGWFTGNLSFWLGIKKSDPLCGYIDICPYMFTLGEDPEPKFWNVFIARMFFVPKAFRMSGQQNCPRKWVKHRNAMKCLHH